MKAPAAALAPRELLAALAVVLIWGSNFVVMKAAMRDFTPFQLGAARYLFAVLPLVLLVRPPRLAWHWVVLYGLFQGLGQFGFLFCALRAGMTASLASVLMQTQVFFTALLGFLLLRERPAPPLLAGLGLAALALACFAMTYLAAPGGAPAATTALGFVLNLGAAAMWGVSNIVARKAQQSSPGFDPLALVVWGSLVPVLPFLLLSWWLDPPSAHGAWATARLSSWVGAAYLGWVATALAYGLWTHLLKRHPANRIAPFGLGVPVVGLAAGMLLLGETLDGWQAAGIVLVVAALLSVMFGPGLQAALLRRRAGAAVRPPHGPT